MLSRLACALVLLGSLVDCSKEPTTPVSRIEPVLPTFPPSIPQPRFGEVSVTVAVTGDSNLFPVGFEIWFYDAPFLAVAPNDSKTLTLVIGATDVRLGREAMPDDDDLYGLACLFGCQYHPFQSANCHALGPLSYRITINESRLETVRFEIHCEKPVISQ